ncbi:MAG TPA: hypothetical protein DHV40_03405, partial [Gammaproteobacteria bacterium]|nr:hypothetical protein [Gammaproteobacteria bacterium]
MGTIYLYLKKNGKMKIILSKSKKVMLKRLIIILAIVHINLAFAMDGMPTMPNPAQIMNESVADIIDPPNTAALNIMASALSSLKELRKSGKATPENIKILIKIKLLPSIAMDVSTE